MVASLVQALFVTFFRGRKKATTANKNFLIHRIQLEMFSFIDKAKFLFQMHFARFWKRVNACSCLHGEFLTFTLLNWQVTSILKNISFAFYSRSQPCKASQAEVLSETCSYWRHSLVVDLQTQRDWLWGHPSLHLPRHPSTISKTRTKTEKENWKSSKSPPI